MKTTIFQITTNSFYKTLITAGLTGLLSLHHVMGMPSTSGPDPVTASSTSPEKLRVLSYTNHSALVLKVHLENPALENVNIQIFNSRNEVIYQQKIGKRISFIGKYNLEQLPDGNYTLLVKSFSHTYTKSFVMQTSVTRAVKPQVRPTSQVTAEAL
jgi:hypothetical protein